MTFRAVHQQLVKPIKKDWCNIMTFDRCRHILYYATPHPTLQPTTIPAYSLTYDGAQALIVTRPRRWYPLLRVRPPTRGNVRG